jgi:hypothetical protein
LEDNIKMFLKGIGYDGVDRIQLEQNMAGCFENSNETLGSIKEQELLGQLNDTCCSSFRFISGL